MISVANDCWMIQEESRGAKMVKERGSFEMSVWRGMKSTTMSLYYFAHR